MKYVVVQRTGFMPYFLTAWRNNGDSCTCGWDCLRGRALVFDGSTARRIANKLNSYNVRRLAAPLPVTVEAAR